MKCTIIPQASTSSTRDIATAAPYGDPDTSWAWRGNPRLWWWRARRSQWLLQRWATGIRPFWQQKLQLDYYRWDLKAKKKIGSSLIQSCFFLLYLLAKLKHLPRSAAHNYCKLQKKCTVNTGMSLFLYICVSDMFFCI